MSVWRPSDKRTLIELVKKNDALYDKNDIHYHHVDFHNVIWGEISKLLGKPAQECREQWNKLSSNFELNYKWLEKLKFLKKNDPDGISIDIYRHGVKLDELTEEETDVIINTIKVFLNNKPENQIGDVTNQNEDV